MSVIVPPLVKPGERLPKSAFYPYLVATTTKAARDHAIERWHLPHWMEDVEIRFEPRAGRMTARVGSDGRAGGRPHDRRPLLAAGVAPLPVVHEGRLGRLPRQHHHGGRAERARGGDGADHALTSTPSTRHLVISEIYEQPFRELWMRDGMPDLRPARPASARLTLWAARPREESPERAHLRRLQPGFRQGAGSPVSVAPVLAALGASAGGSSTRLTTAPGDEARLTRKALADGFRRIVAVGGDGTWSKSERRSCDSGIPAALGLVPGGTGCDLAKTLGIPAAGRRGAAARVILERAHADRSTWAASRAATS